MPDVRAADAMSITTVNGTRGEVMAYVAEHLAYLDDVALRHGLPLPSAPQDPQERAMHLEGLARTVKLGLTYPERVPSPHYLRALAGQAIVWLEELRERGEVSW